MGEWWPRSEAGGAKCDYRSVDNFVSVRKASIFVCGILLLVLVPVCGEMGQLLDTYYWC